MQFKVGDKVRLTREAITYKLIEQRTIKYSIVLWGDITDISDGDGMVMVDYIWYKTEDLELVPEEPELKEGDLVEIVDETGVCNKRIFVAKLPDMVKAPYVIVLKEDEDLYRNNKPYRISRYQYISKLKHKLTRKEIAEKFWVDKDFELVD